MTDDLPHYVEGASFLRIGDEVDMDLWPREPSAYRPSNKFYLRMRMLAGIIKGDDIEQAIRFGETYPAARGCLAFVSDLGGMAIYVIAGADIRDPDAVKGLRPSSQEIDFGLDDLDHYIVTLWVHVYDADAAWKTGRWSRDQISTVEEIEPGDFTAGDS